VNRSGQSRLLVAGRAASTVIACMRSSSTVKPRRCWGVAGLVLRAPGVRDSERFDLEAVLIGGHTNASSYSAEQVRIDVLNRWPTRNR
jgi:hypothetical protein